MSYKWTGKVHGADNWHGKIGTSLIMLLFGTVCCTNYMNFTLYGWNLSDFSLDWFVRYNDGHIGRSVYYPNYLACLRKLILLISNFYCRILSRIKYLRRSQSDINSKSNTQTMESLVGLIKF